MTLQDDKILEIINKFKNQELPEEAALAQIKSLQYTDLGFAKLDNNRAERQGFPEVIYCAGKTPEQCAEIMGNKVNCVYDVGVAGIHRLFAQLEVIRAANVLIVVAGMEGALASVVGGLVNRPVVAVPTSVGYGANFGGLSALLGMLNSCSAGVAVVNIDNGFGAGRLASIINHMR